MSTPLPSSAPPLRFVIIGAGLSGIMSAIELARAGYRDVTVYEKADRVGGTWRENTYPGVACDVPSHLYCYSFAPNPDFSRMYSPGHEIQAYIESVAARHELNPRIRFCEEVTRCEYADGGWQLQTSKGRRDRADVLIAATGVTHHPRVPELPGLPDFAGSAFHSARWDHGVATQGKRVGIVGTSSTAVQLVAALVDEVEKLSLFQRTPQWIMPQDNQRYSPEQRAQFRDEPEKLAALRAFLSRRFAENFSDAVVDVDSPGLAAIEEGSRAHLESAVRDPVLREKLRPDYRAACKRLIISSEFYPAIQRPNAELVTDGIERVEAQGIRTRDGRLHPLDVLVFATGFQTDRFVRPTEVIGRDGQRLDQVWGQSPTAYLSIAVPGFPNLFMLNGPSSPVGNFSLIEVAELQMRYALQLVAHLRDGGPRSVGVSAAAAASFEAERVEATKRTVWVTGCKSWYLDARGIPASWPWTLKRFREVMQTPDLSAFELS
jgi:cation diffusion facilitator CzcD-associated flavoprotein CzcO